MKQFNQQGQIFILALIVLTLITINTVLTIGNSLSLNQSSKYSLQDVQAINLAEAGLDKAVAALNTSGGSYNGESETFIGQGSYSVTITNKDASTKIIKATGYLPNKTNPKVKRTVETLISSGTGTSFVYGMQVGNGGIDMGNSSTINGSLYSNGNVTAGNGGNITGDIWVAGGTQPTPDQQSDCTDPNCQDFIFGKNVSGNNQLDVGQSFKPDATAVINKVSLKLKKFNSPANLTVRLMRDASGKPDKNNVITTGTLNASLVTTSYSFVDVTFAATPTLAADTTYWIMLDTSNDNTNYWAWSKDTTQGYTRGGSSWSPNWQASSPVWTTIPGDLGFKTYMGGVATYVDLGNGSTINGNVHANTIRNVTIKKDAYYQTIINSTVQGTSYPGSSDPPPVNMPISEANIADWKNQAQSGGVTTGDVTGCSQTLGPSKIVGNVTIGNTCTVTIKSPLWVTGNIITGNGTQFVLESAAGASSGLVIIDGTTTFGNASDFVGSGTAGSYLMLLSTYDSTSNNVSAVTTGNGSFSGIIYAPNGKVDLANGATFKELIGWKIIMGNGAQLNYQTGLASLSFSSGPTGSYSVIKGTYQVK